MTDTPPWPGQPGHPGQGQGRPLAGPPGPDPGYRPAGGPGRDPGYWPVQPGLVTGYPRPGPATPAPGAVPLRPLGVGDILGGAFTLVRQNPAATLGLTAVTVTAQVVVSLVILLVARVTSGLIALLAGPALIALFALQLGGLAAAMGRSLLGRRLTVPEAARLSRAGWVAVAMVLLGAGFLVLWTPLLAAAKGWGALIALLVTAWLAVMVSLTVPAVVLERRGPFSAIGRSWRLVLGSYWRVFGIYLLMDIIVWVVSLVALLPIQLAGGLAAGLGATGNHAGLSLAVVVLAIGEIVVVSLTVTIEAGVLVLVYADMRMRKEGMDLVLQQAALAGQLTGEEFATTGPGGAYTGGAYPGAAYRGGTYQGGGCGTGLPGAG